MPPPVMMVPKSWPNTQITAATTMARTKVARAACRGRYAPAATVTSTAASTAEAAKP